jgi:hypothetical protein
MRGDLFMKLNADNGTQSLTALGKRRQVFDKRGRLFLKKAPSLKGGDDAMSESFLKIF